MDDMENWARFWRGRVVIEIGPLCEDNPGHVVGFTRHTDGRVLIRVEFANGDRYNLDPDELKTL